MEPSGFEPLTPCMPFRHLTKSNQFKSQVLVSFLRVVMRQTVRQVVGALETDGSIPLGRIPSSIQ